MREEIRKTKRLTEKPFAVNLIPTVENDIWTPPIVEAVKEEGLKRWFIPAMVKELSFLAVCHA